MKKQTHLGYSLDDLRLSTFTANVHFWVTYSFRRKGLSDGHIYDHDIKSCIHCLKLESRLAVVVSCVQRALYNQRSACGRPVGVSS